VTINGTNDAAIVTGDISGEVTEQGSSGIQPESTFSSASGKLDDTDVDNPSHLFQEQGTLDSSGALLTGESSTYGKFAIDSSGRWAYELDNSNPLVNALNNGDTRHDYFFVRTSDGTQQLIDITIHGTNDSTAITGNDSGNVTEAGSERTYTFDNSSGFSDLYSMTHNTFDSYEARGTLAGASDFNEVSIAPTAYGTFSIDRSGNWTYDLDNSNPDVNALNTTGYMDDTYTVSTKDGAQKTVTIHIAGTNDAAYFGGILDGSITEQDANSDLSYNSSISGLALVVNDVDNGVNFTADAALSDQGFGSFTIDSSGQWTYILDNSNLTVEQLDQGQTLSDSFTIHSEDGTPQVINITIHGATDYSELPSNPEDSFNAEPGSYIIHAGALGNQVGDVSANSGNDLIIVAPHDPSSLVSGGTILPHDVIHNFTLDTENKTNDIIVLGTSDSQPRIEAFNSLGNMSTANNTISGHSIDQYGVITFLGGNGSLAEKIDYLINNDINGQLSTTKGSTVVFTDNTNISYVYSQQGPDAGIISGYSFVEVQGNYAAEGLDIGPQNVHHNNYIHIDHQ
jgi:VCBS repeat-containing protein